MSMDTVSFEHRMALEKSLVGGKGYGLAVMAQAGIPVSPGFIVTTDTYRQYLEHSGLRNRISEAVASVDRTSIKALDETARRIAAWFDDVALPDHLRQTLGEAYGQLCRAVNVVDVSVAVRSSATAEDSEGASFAGEYETFIGMRGLEQVELHLRRCWASAFTARALIYAGKNDLDPMAVDMAVVVQKTVSARASGVMFTISPVSGDRSRVVIEAAYGLGLGVVGGDVTPDRYVVAKIEGQVVEHVVGDKHVEYLTGDAPTPVAPERRAQLCLSDVEVLALAKIGKRLERMHEAPQDIEFAIDRDLPAGDNIVLLQCRPITVQPSARRTRERDPLARFASSVLEAAR